MSTQRHETVPEWTLGDRLRKARSLTGMTVHEFAEAIGVSDRTINNAEGDKRAVRQITLRAWAMATGVSLPWLESGVGGVTPPGGGQTDAVEQLAASKRGRTKKGASDLVTGEYLQVA